MRKYYPGSGKNFAAKKSGNFKMLPTDSKQVLTETQTIDMSGDSSGAVGALNSCDNLYQIITQQQAFLASAKLTPDAYNQAQAQLNDAISKFNASGCVWPGSQSPPILPPAQTDGVGSTPTVDNPTHPAADTAATLSMPSAAGTGLPFGSGSGGGGGGSSAPDDSLMSKNYFWLVVIGTAIASFVLFGHKNIAGGAL